MTSEDKIRIIRNWTGSFEISVDTYLGEEYYQSTIRYTNGFRWNSKSYTNRDVMIQFVYGMVSDIVRNEVKATQLK